MTIRNPAEWGASQFKLWSQAIGSAGHAVYGAEGNRNALIPSIRRIRTADLWDALAKGVDDFKAYRTDVIFLCLIYPTVGLILARIIFGYGLWYMLFPLVSGFALIGPFAAVGLYEMSRQREEGTTVTWADAFDVLRSPSFGAILVLGLILTGIFLLWLLAAQVIYALTLGPEPPVSISWFIHDVFTTGAGWAMIGIGVAVGFLFAVLTLAVSVVSFPLLLDRKVGVATAIWTSIHAAMANPGAMAMWGLIVVGGLIIGSLPLLVGLAIVMPVLGHATWHLYRKLIAR